MSFSLCELVEDILRPLLVCVKMLVEYIREKKPLHDNKKKDKFDTDDAPKRFTDFHVFKSFAIKAKDIFNGGDDAHAHCVAYGVFHDGQSLLSSPLHPTLSICLHEIFEVPQKAKPSQILHDKDQ